MSFLGTFRINDTIRSPVLKALPRSGINRRALICRETCFKGVSAILVCLRRPSEFKSRQLEKEPGNMLNGRQLVGVVSFRI